MSQRPSHGPKLSASARPEVWYLRSNNVSIHRRPLVHVRSANVQPQQRHSPKAEALVYPALNGLENAKFRSSCHGPSLDDLAWSARLAIDMMLTAESGLRGVGCSYARCWYCRPPWP